jgi:tetratricopeptide (TPR) repeat protein
MDVTRPGLRHSLVLLLLASAMPAAAAGAAPKAKTECDQAIERFDANYGGNGDDAAFAAAKALEKTCAKPDAAHARALSRLGIVQFGRGDVVEAAVAFEAAAELNPKDAVLRLNVCGALTQLERQDDAIAACETGLELAKAQDDGSADARDTVLKLGYNLALAKVRRGRGLCADHSIWEMFDAYREANPEFPMVYQMLGAWVWDCEDDFKRGFAFYKKSCQLGQESACEQVRYTEACRCEERRKDI